MTHKQRSYAAQVNLGSSSMACVTSRLRLEGEAVRETGFDRRHIHIAEP